MGHFKPEFEGIEGKLDGEIKALSPQSNGERILDREGLLRELEMHKRQVEESKIKLAKLQNDLEKTEPKNGMEGLSLQYQIRDEGYKLKASNALIESIEEQLRRKI